MKPQLFNYKIGFSFGVFTPAFAFFGLTLCDFFYQGNLQFKNLQELPYANVLYLLGVIGFIFYFMLFNITENLGLLNAIFSL